MKRTHNMHRTFNWDGHHWDDLYDDIYDREKYGYNNSHIEKDDDNDIRAELEQIVSDIRMDIYNSRISAYVNKFLQIIIELRLNNVESMYSIMEGMEELNQIRLKHLSEFGTSNFEIAMEKDNPTIYCSYERI